jgi:fibulin 1/2
MLSGEYQCEEINECTSTQYPHHCEQGCVNIAGSFSCTCLSGYRLNGRTQCDDIDECSESSPCSQMCMNNLGGYSCSCDVGYDLVDKTACVG